MMVAKSPGRFPGLHQQLWGNVLVGGLDCDRYAMSHAGRGGSPSIVIYGPDFEVLYTGGDCFKGPFYVKKPGNPPVNYEALLEGLKQAGDKGLLGGLTVPEKLKPLLPLVRAARLSDALRSLKTVPENGELGEFAKELTKRIEALRERKKKLFEDLEKAGDKWAAFKAGSSYVRVFPGESDTGEVRGKVGKLQYDAVVKKELEAQRVFAQLIPMIYGPKRNPTVLQQKAQLFKQVIDKYKGTEFGDLAEKLSGS